LVILVTGATTGIGKAAALSFAREGHHVIATGRKLAALETLKSEAADLHLDIALLDVTDATSVTTAAAEVKRLTDGHGVDVLINNAGYGQPGPVADLSDEDLRAQLETNVLGLQRVTRAFLPDMIGRRFGRILNVSSVGGRVTFPMFGAYHASKYAVEALSDALRMEVRPFGVEVSLIEPGPIKTEFAKRSLDEVSRVRNLTNQASPWAEVYANATAIAEQTDKLAGAPEDVVAAMRHAIRARRPRARYVMPFLSRFSLFFMMLMPTFLLDAVMMRFIGLGRRRLAARKPVPALSLAEKA
ncbi:MAG: SDR family oxidoreductase, partial [Polyangiales bacterium]